MAARLIESSLSSFIAYNAYVWTHGRKGLDFPLARGQINSRLSHWTANKPGRPGLLPFFPYFFRLQPCIPCRSLLPPFLIQYPKKRAFNYESSEESYLVFGNEIDDGIG